MISNNRANNVGRSNRCFQILVAFAAGVALLLTTYLTAHYNRYGPLDIVSKVKNAGSSSAKLFGDHLQFVGGLQEYKVPAIIYSTRPSKITCSGQSVQKKHLFSNLSTTENYPCSSSLSGFLISPDKTVSLITSIIQTDLVHSFSKDVIEDIKNDFEWRGDILAIGPAISIKNNPQEPFELVLVSRIYLNKEKHYVKQAVSNLTQAEVALFDNYLYKSSYDVNLKKQMHGSLLRCNIPRVKKALSGDGPMDPRIFFYDNRLFVLFNAVVKDASTNNLVDRMFIFVPDNGPDAVYELKVDGIKLSPRDKGWVPLITNEKKLLFIYRFEPLCIIECDPKDFTKPCLPVIPPDRTYASGQKFPDLAFHLRGGTPFVAYMHPYYVSLAHGTFFTKSGTRYYTQNIVLLNVQSQNIVYVSSDLLFSQKMLEREPIERPWITAYPSVFPLGIHVSSQDELVVSGHINDRDAVLLRITGVQAIFDAAIAMELKSVGGSHDPSKTNSYGLLNSLLVKQLSNETGLEFRDSL